MAPEKKERQTETPTLRDLVVKTTLTYRRVLPGNISMVELGIFDEEAARIRDMERVNPSVAALAVVEHATRKVLLSEPKVVPAYEKIFLPTIGINIYQISSPRLSRQDKSIGLAIGSEKLALPMVVGLLLGESSAVAPSSIMAVSQDGTHLFFRTLDTPDQKEGQQMQTVLQSKGVSLSDFAKKYHLAHFYAPIGQTVATPVVF